MNRESLVKLRQQLDAALASGTPEAQAALVQALGEALGDLGPANPAGDPGAELDRALEALEEAWFKGTPPTAGLAGSPERQAKLLRLLAEVLEVQDFAVRLAKGDLSPALKVKGAMAGGLKSLQSSLRHLTWQTQRIARGDFDQRVDFMGEFSASFNAMTRNLAEARDQLKRHGEELAQANASLRAEIAERRRAENLIQDLNRQLNQKVADLLEANKDMEAFSYSVSHDLRAPLRAIQGYARMLMEEHAPHLDAEGLRLLQVISHNARLMAKLIEDLLAFARLGKQEVKKTDLDMTALARSLFRELQGWGPPRQVSLTLKPLPPARGDRALMNQVWVNLLSNALKFTGPRKTAAIDIGGWTEAGEQIYYVKDNGVGFDMQDAEKLFRVFLRLDPSSAFEGTGVGLAIVQKIIQRHGGRVWAEGRVNEGATFYFSLPRASGAGPDEETGS